MRDSIVYGCDWETGSAIERIALALAHAGAKVLHCDSSTSLFRQPETSLREVEPRLFTFKPWVFAHRLNRLPGMPSVQAKLVARQILGHARRLRLNRPVFLYASMGALLEPLCETLRRHGFLLVHVAMDYTMNLSPRHVGQSDLTLVFSRTGAQGMRARWGAKIHQIPHAVDLRCFQNLRACPENPPKLLAEVPRPRLGYGGCFGAEFLNTRVLRELLERRPEWSFISFQSRAERFGLAKAVPLPNVHVMSRQASTEFARCVAAFDVGFMPYDCSNVVLYNGPPMKLWDYFALGIPVVATPLIHLWEYDGLVYLGETATELEHAVERALMEPGDSTLRQQRKDLAEKHSLEAISSILETILG